METYITFGQIHVHNVSGKTLDKDCVAVLTHADHESGHEIAMKLFDTKFHMAYSEAPGPDVMQYFPRGFVAI